MHIKVIFGKYKETTWKTWTVMGGKCGNWCWRTKVWGCVLDLSG